jgi:cyclic beta-1,2-glucan synthetase
MSLRNGVPDELRTVVAVPTIGEEGGVDAVRRHGDPVGGHAVQLDDDNLSFALLGDFADADAETLPEDAAIVETAVQLIAALNEEHGQGRFYLLHRRRLWNPSEQRWRGWERKRGKLHEFNRLLRGAEDTTFVVKVGSLARLPAVRFVITLDSDTDPAGRGRKLVRRWRIR